MAKFHDSAEAVLAVVIITRRRVNCIVMIIVTDADSAERIVIGWDRIWQSVNPGI
jgi:hypothetical protein